MRRFAFYSCLTGIVVVFLAWTSMQCVQIVNNAFVTSPSVGWLTLSGVLLVVFGMLYLVGHELFGYLQVRKINQLAIAMHRGDVEPLRRRARQWLHHTQDEKVISSVMAATTTDEIVEKLEYVFLQIDSRVDKIIAAEAAIAGAIVGISPWPLIDAGIVAWRQLRLVRRIASEYGLRPGIIGTLRLLRQIAIAVVFADVSEHATQWLSSKVPSMGGLLPAAGQAVAIGVLTVRVGRACKRVCKPNTKKVIIPRSGPVTSSFDCKSRRKSLFHFLTPSFGSPK